MDPAPQYVRPHFFDWGAFKPHGTLILLLTTAAYLACIVLSIVLLRQIAQRFGTTAAGLCGILTVGPMLFMGWRSVSLQSTSSHYQETTHIPAVMTFAICFSIVLGFWLLNRVR